MRIVGADPSLTSFGVAIFTPDRPTWRESMSAVTLNPCKRRRAMFDRQVYLTSKFSELLRPGDLVVFEDFGIAGMAGISGKLVERLELCGMLKLVAVRKTKRQFVEAHPSRLRSFTKGNSRPDKRDMVNAVRVLWRTPVRNHDEADAVSMALFAMMAERKVRGVSDWDRLVVSGGPDLSLSKKQKTMVGRFLSDNQGRI